LPLINIGNLDTDWYEGITHKLKWNQRIRMPIDASKPGGGNLKAASTQQSQRHVLGVEVAAAAGGGDADAVVTLNNARVQDWANGVDYG
jgi:NAD+ kinase